MTPLYLSRLILNPLNPGARRDAARPYDLHRTLMRGIDGKHDERLLFRLEPDSAPSGPVVLVQTETPPEWASLLANGYLLRADGPKAFNPVLQQGQMLTFRLWANPVKKVGNKRIPLKRAEPKAEDDTTYWQWLLRQAERAGFAVVQARDAPSPTRRVGEGRTLKKEEIPHFGVRFDGVLEVKNPEQVREALRHGIGPAKAFGFGLLSLANTALTP